MCPPPPLYFSSPSFGLSNKRADLGCKQVNGVAKHDTLVKICGIKSEEAALAATEAGADMLGFIFAPKSKRFVEPAQARRIADAVRSSSAWSSRRMGSKGKEPARDWFSLQTSILDRKRKPLIVGVFQNAALETVLDTIDEVGLDVVQLHGDEPLAWARLIPVPVVRAFHVDATAEISGDGQVEEALRDAARPGYHAVPLLDTKVGSGKGALSGGAGKTFDWSVARRLVLSGTSQSSAGHEAQRLPVILAGGIDASNVRDAIAQVDPWALDISGGVETDGQKDIAKIRELLKLVKSSSAA